MSMAAVAIKCPTCGSTVNDTSAGEKQCEFCLTMFTVIDSQREQEKRAEDVRRWLEGHLGSAAFTGAVVDAASRNYIFNERIRPSLEREVNRALEGLGSYQQAPVVHLPAPVESPGMGGNPLVEKREEILQLNLQRARFESPDVTTFASGEREQGALRVLLRRLEDVMLLSNAAHASRRNGSPGYPATRKNLEELLAKINLVSISEQTSQPDLVAFLALLKERYRIDIDLTSIAEELTSPNSISGAALEERVLALEERLEELGGKMMDCPYNPAETMSVVMGINEERKRTGLLASWLRAYDAVGQNTMMSFTDFCRAIEQAGTGMVADPVEKTQLLAGIAEFFRILHGERPAFVIQTDHGLDGWLASQRERKFLGLFGNGERIEETRHFHLPVWIVDVGFSMSSGVIFVEGCEHRCLAVVDACYPSKDSVVFLEGAMARHQGAMTNAGSPPSGSIAIPRSTAEVAEAYVKYAAQDQGNRQNVQVRALTIGFVPAVSAVLRSDKGNRALAAIFGGSIRIDPRAGQTVDAVADLTQRFSRKQ